MKLAVITDSSAYLEAKILQRENLFILDIPVNIDGQEYVERCKSNRSRIL